mmetsp:Transcript_6607/g.19929  ORF Transcript_6607/g.19929 Transcript_6607/m.19929 type:complete len:335 (+) Transcript_6607:244-1248(+)
MLLTVNATCPHSTDRSDTACMEDCASTLPLGVPKAQHIGLRACHEWNIQSGPLRRGPSHPWPRESAYCSGSSPACHGLFLLLEILGEHIGAERETLSLLDYLLVYVGWLDAKENMPRLLVDARVELGVRYHLDDPLLGGEPLHTQLLRERLEVDALMNAAVRLEDVKTRVREEVGRGIAQEEVILDSRGAGDEALLGLLEVGRVVEIVEECSDGVQEDRLLHGDDAHKLFDEMTAARCGDDGDSQVAQKVRASGLNRVQIPLREEEVAHDLTTAGMVRQQEERPVHQPGALLQLHDGGRRGRARLNSIAQRAQFLKRSIPSAEEDLAGEPAPLG